MSRDCVIELDSEQYVRAIRELTEFMSGRLRRALRGEETDVVGFGLDLLTPEFDIARSDDTATTLTVRPRAKLQELLADLRGKG